MGAGSIIGTIASFVVGGAVATVTIIGLVDSQTGPSGTSPASVSEPVVDYGTTP